MARPYSTADDLYKAITEETVTALVNDEGVENSSEMSARVTEAIGKADGLIDSYMGGRYTVPLDSVPDIIRSLSVDLVIYMLYSRYEESVPEVRDKNYEHALRTLREIRDGKMPLPLEAVTGGTASVSGSFSSGVVVTDHSAP